MDNSTNVRHVYMVAICGTGMATLAAMFKSKGYPVSGSDQDVYPPMSTFLQDNNIPVYTGFDPAHLAEAPAVVVIGNAMSRGNPEVEYVLNEKLPYTSLPAALREYFIRGHYSCVVTGTHGKTTTTSMLAWILEHAGQRPSFFIGGICENFGRGYQLAGGQHFVIEGDEYDSAFFDKGPKFLHYLPDLVIINNIEYDHADIYRNLDEIKTAFRRLLNLVPGKGHIVANFDDPVVAELTRRVFSNLHHFGLGAEVSWRAHDIDFSASGTQFCISHNGQFVCEAATTLFGEHNVRNALAAFVAARQLGLQPADIVAGLRTFRGVRRRMTRIADVGGILIYEDFAHHATAIRETLQAFRLRFPRRRLWALFEPRSASAKRKVFEQQYYDAFDNADQVVFAPLHRPDKVPEQERLSVERIIDVLRNKQIQAHTVSPGIPMLELLTGAAQPGDVFIFMGNGDFAYMPTRLAEALVKKNEVRGTENG